MVAFLLGVLRCYENGSHLDCRRPLWARHNPLVVRPTSPVTNCSGCCMQRNRARLSSGSHTQKPNASCLKSPRGAMGWLHLSCWSIL